MTNIQFAKNILQKIADWGVKTLVVCPGGRNAPFISLLEKSHGFEILSFYDERSAGFFALGRARRDERPVAVITTSGTAVSELMSPCIEAYYSQTPLLLLTADRPKRLRNTGAPQTIEQKNLFGSYVEECFDLEKEDIVDLSWKQTKPIHLNICFDEPLIDEASASYDFSSPERWEFPVEEEDNSFALKKWLEDKKNPLLVVGGLSDKSSWSLEKQLVSWGGALYLESSSGLRESPLLKNKILSGDRFVQEQLKENNFDGILRLGDVPLAKFWRQLDNFDVPVFCFNDKNLKGVEKAEMQVGRWEDFRLPQKTIQGAGCDHDPVVNSKILDLVTKHPLSEPAFFQWLSRQIPESATVYLGNSLPVRLWDLFAERSKRFHTKVSRGANGIDGQISTGLGVACENKEHWIILGDLTSLYDFSGLWVTEQLKKQSMKIRLVVVNNNGGQIFSRIFKEKLFLNQHNLKFKPFAEMWGWDYYLFSQAENLDKNMSSFSLIEVQPNNQETNAFWEDFDQLWK